MKTLLLTFAWLISAQALAQLPDYHVQLFDESFGIRTSEVRKVIVDNKGFVWIMHEDRVQKFDGKHVMNFILEPSLQSILCDRDNQIWVSSFSKLYRLVDERRGFNVVPVDTTQNLGLAALYQFPHEAVWILTTHGYYALDSSGTFRKHKDPILGQVTRVQTRGRDVGPNSVFFSTSDSLVVYHLKTHTRRVLPLPQYNIRTVNALSDDVAFVSIWKGIVYIYDFLENRITEIDMSQHLDEVHDFFVSIFDVHRLSQQKYLLASTKGLLEYDIITRDFRILRLFHKGKPLEGNLFFMDLHDDQSGTMWMAYTNYGLVSFKTGAGTIGLIRNYETDIHKAWDNHVRNFAADTDGNLWLGTFNGFVRWDMDAGVLEPYFATEGATDKFNHPSIRGIVFDGTNLILGQTNRGIWLYNPRTETYRRPIYAPGENGEQTRLKLEASFIDQIYTLRNGDHMIAGSNACYLLERGTYLVREIDFAQKDDNVDFIYQDGKEHIWIGTTRRLYCLEPNFTHLFSIDKSQTSGLVNVLCQWTDSTFIAGGKGLHMITVRDTSTLIRTVHSYFDKFEIHIVYKDLKNKLWLATSEGLYRFDMETQRIESFSYFESIEGNSFYQNSFYRAKDNGLLFLGSSRGIIYFHPEQVGEQTDSLHIYITTLMVNNDDSSYTMTDDPMQLKYMQNTLAFDYVAPYFGNASKIRYRYQLEGLNSDWVENGNNTNVRFHALQPGQYVFKVGASINGVHWFESSDSISFSIAPPFWRTWWFSSAIILTIASIVYALYRYQLNKKLEVERLRMGIARDLHDDIGSALSNIHILSSMAMKKHEDTENANPVFGKIKESSKIILENMQDIVWAINPINDTLEQVLSKMKEFAGEICESAGIDYTFDIDENLESIRLTINKRKDLFLVFKEAMNNAVKYSGCNEIRISFLKRANGWLILKINDNGKGFAVSEVQRGNGLRNMQSRAKEVQGQIQIESGNGNGTQVELRIPIK